MIQDVLDIAAENELNLDFTDDSIKEVEKYLAALHQHYISTRNDEGLPFKYKILVIENTD